MKMTIGNKILLSVGALIFTILGFQTLFSIHLVSEDLKHGVTEKIEANARASVDALADLRNGTTADLTVIGAHRAIENYLTFRVFGDDDGMTENLAELELFLARIYKAKPRYIGIQFLDRDGTALEVSKGTRIEKHGRSNGAAEFARVDKLLNSGKPPVFHKIVEDSGMLAMISVAAIVVEGRAEGMIRLRQPIQNLLMALISEVGKNRLSVVISEAGGHIVASSVGLSNEEASGLARQEMSGWVTVAREIPALDLKMTLGMKASEAFAVVTDLKSTSLAIFVVSLVVAAGVLVLVVRTISRPLSKISHALEDIAEGEGDLTRRLKAAGSGEVALVANGFNQFAEKVRQLVTEVSGSIGQFSAAMNTTAIIAEQTSRDNLRQQAETDQVATAINEMSVANQQVAKDAAHAASAANEADSQAHSSKEVIKQSLEAVEALARKVTSAGQTVNQLSEDSANVGKVLEVIQSIAEQTNLLALNAAIEAARAGESGRGFSVVADEVRTLASRTQTSTEEIRDIIERLQTGARKAETAMQEGKEEADRNVEQAAVAERALDNIAEAVTTIKGLSCQIATATEEQTAVTEDIHRSIVNINELGKQTATGAQETARSSEELMQRAEQVQKVLGQFRV